MRYTLRQIKLLLRDLFLGWFLFKCDLPETSIAFATELKKQMDKEPDYRTYKANRTSDES